MADVKTCCQLAADAQPWVDRIFLTKGALPLESTTYVAMHAGKSDLLTVSTIRPPERGEIGVAEAADEVQKVHNRTSND